MLATVLAQPQRDEGARLRVWRQIVDLLAQGRHGASQATIDRAYAVARQIRPEIPLPVRASAAAACITGRVPAALIAFFAEEDPEIAGPLLSAATLDADEWLAILPMLSTFAKGRLRAREDLPEALAYALGVALDPQESGSQISDLLTRIEAFRKRAPDPVPAPAAPVAPPRPAAPSIAVTIDSFRFTVDEAGILTPREPAPAGIPRMSIAGVAETPDHGVDGHAAGAWRRRAAFSEARLSIGGTGPGAGPWRISAEPCFAAPDGRFVGYAGEARRPRVEEAADTTLQPEPPVETPAIAPPEPARIALLMEALRGPIDAIGLLAPGAPMASGRATVALRLLGGTGAETESEVPYDDRLDAAAILSRLHAAYQPEMTERGVRLSFRIAAGLPPIAADPGAVERMFARLLASTLGIARRGECVAARVGLDRRDGSLLSISLSRPGALMGLDERTLLGPALDAEGDFPDAPRLALSFAIRLVRNLAGDAGGRLDIAPDRFVLTLPLVDTRVAVEQQG